MRRTRLPALALIATVAFTGVAAAQPQRAADVSPLVQFVVSLLTTLVVGGLTIAIAPRFAERVVDDCRSDPVASALIGIATLVLVFIVVFIAALFGPLVILVAIPIGLFGAVAQALGVTALGCVVVDQFDEASVWTGLLVGTPLVALTSFVPLVGTVIGFTVGVIGVGAIVRDQGWV